MHRLFKCVIIITLCTLLSACAQILTQDAAPVVNRPIKSDEIPEVYVVRPGDSLYAIAWRYDLDFKDVAQNNHLFSPYQIYPGEKLYLRQVSPKIHKQVVALGKKPKRIPSKDNKIEVVDKLAKNKPQTKASTKIAKKEKSTPATYSNYSKEKWLIPASGPILKRYSEKANDFNKGIDIGGKLNEKVFAARSGRVVYSGAGLRGYGKLIIIKHNDTFLSAYAHNNEILVSEGDQVNQGQLIARMGSTDSQHIKLHFQIRKNGHPVDPARYLRL